MQEEKMNVLLGDDLSFEVINSFYEVHRKLGPGFLEKLYHNGLYYILKKRGFLVESEKRFTVKIDEFVVGDYFADIVVNDEILIEVKSCKKLLPVHEAQVISYLRASGLPVGLLVNFRNERVYFRRLTNF